MRLNNSAAIGNSIGYATEPSNSTNSQQRILRFDSWNSGGYKYEIFIPLCTDNIYD